MSRSRKRTVVMTVESAARVLLVTRGDRAYDEAESRMNKARNAGMVNEARFWQAVAKVIDIGHPRTGDGT